MHNGIGSRTGLIKIEFLVFIFLFRVIVGIAGACTASKVYWRQFNSNAHTTIDTGFWMREKHFKQQQKKSTLNRFRKLSKSI